ncbi:MAG TPA: hypothetical protein VKQ27_20205 [Acetobacteraceae bacterium]|nr:hypothetical protein [Acetobacteraceae bacterium]
MVGEIATVVLTLIVGLVVWDFLHNYTGAPDETKGMLWQRILHGGMGSSTVLVSYLTLIGGWCMTAAGQIGDLVGQPAVHEWLNAHLSAEGMGAVMAGVAVLTFIARLRTL